MSSRTSLHTAVALSLAGTLFSGTWSERDAQRSV